MIGIGCDLVEITRVEKAMQNPRFLPRVFTQQEQRHIGQNAQRAAGIWAAKEACAKALGTGFRGFSLVDVQLGWDELGKPQIALVGGAQQRFDALHANTMHISISHDGGLAMAFAMLE